jgi:phage recombination protein Bet
MSTIQGTAVPIIPREGVAAQPAVPEVQKQTILDYLKAFGLASELTEPEKLQFVEIAQAFRLNPFKREIHVAVFGEGEYRKLSIITGYEVYLKRADRTGKLDGWRAWIEGEGEQTKALVEIHRKDWSEPFIHEVYWREAVQKKRDGTPTAFWTKQPRFQLKKVAISQGFRLAFPDELGGMPYDAAELPDQESIQPMSPVPGTTQQGANVLSVEEPSPAIPVILAPEDKLQKAGRPVVMDAGRIQNTAAIPVQSERYPDEEPQQLFERLNLYLDDNHEAFTERHAEWILDKAHKAANREGILKMITYAEKVVRNAQADASILA